MGVFIGKKALVIGSGSIGTRHAINLVSLGLEVIVFSRRSNLNEVGAQNIEYTNDANQVAAQYFDVCVIASATNLHLSDAMWALSFCSHFYIEKPLSSSSKGVDGLIQRLATKRSVVDAGFMLRSHPNVIAIKKFVDSGELGALHYCHAHVGQWLGDWRPGTDYKRSYSSNSQNGGGVVLDLIHEIDLVNYLFGPVVDLCADVSISSYLGIESEALAFINVTHSNGFKSALRLDYLRPSFQRSLEIVGSGGLLEWDYSVGSVLFRSASKSHRVVHKVSEGYTRNDMFMAHMKSFLEACFTGGNPRSSIYDASHALNVACTAKGIETLGYR